ncbi:class I SAM-dependent methyltransferase [Magnetospirillum sp. SS-4]|uniref:class I SAM-dependent DNA methyltransferase n=1 Tax=Magnetospirillum sp. SS-4 TaxID=2681465 RepID=UPI0015720237|nr:methyltransferase domain-containing protein [Magnetospirillum sp. SS-4]
MFGECLTAELPTPAAHGEVIKEYDAELYDRQSTHLDSIAEFQAFLGDHLDGGGPWEIIDAPCGTGLAGPILKPWARRLVGLDLVPAMVSQAERLGCYDDLLVGDLLDMLPRLRAEMVVCHGALYYFRDLAPIVAAVAACLSQGGYFAFTDFPAPEGVMATRGGNARFCRSPSLVRELLESNGFAEVASELRLSFTLPCLYWIFRKR